MKKVLFITTRNPFSGRYSGDVIRSLKIINLIRKKYKLDIVCLSDNQNINEKNLITFKYPNLFFKIIYSFFSLLKFQPMQFGLFFSKEMKDYLDNNAINYDYLFFYHIRSSQYLPSTQYCKTIVEMGDIYSDNYLQTYQNLNFLNPIKYIYLLESYLVRNIEHKIFSNFDRIVLFSKNEAEKINKNFKQKIFQIDESVDLIKKKYIFSKKNSNILFVGNINYLPNLLACKKFVINILPKLKKQSSNIKLIIIGNISNFNKFFLSKFANVEILGPKKDLSKYIKNCFCGLANLDIATGVQGKVLTYMSHGLPVICSEKVAKNFGLNVEKYKSNSDLIDKIINIQKDKRKNINLSKKAITFSKRLTWSKVSVKYLKLLKF